MNWLQMARRVKSTLASIVRRLDYFYIRMCWIDAVKKRERAEDALEMAEADENFYLRWMVELREQLSAPNTNLSGTGHAAGTVYARNSGSGKVQP